MAENFISVFYTWVTGNVITADRLNGNINNIIDGLSGGVKTLNVGKLQISNVDVINNSREATFTKITVGDIVIDNSKNAVQNFSKTVTSLGVTIATISLGDNSGAIIDVFGSGLVDGSAMSSFNGKWSVYRTSGVTTINSIQDEVRDGGEKGYFTVTQSGNDIIIKAFTDDSGVWTVAGDYRIKSSGTLSIS